MFNQARFYLREYFFPSGCGGCGGVLIGPEDAYYGLCGDCRALFAAALAGDKHCEICGKPLISERPLSSGLEACLPCRERAADGTFNNRFVKFRALFPYTGRFKAILRAYKFGKSLGAGNFLAQCLSSILMDFVPGAAAWVPVPPRPGKIKTQGWDQIEYLAGLLEKEYRCRRKTPVHHCLKRLPSRSQKELNREERISNLKGRILCTKPPPKRAVIFDDVITTGTTLNACAEALLKKGAAEVYGVCLFYD